MSEASYRIKCPSCGSKQIEWMDKDTIADEQDYWRNHWLSIGEDEREVNEMVYPIPHHICLECAEIFLTD